MPDDIAPLPAGVADAFDIVGRRRVHDGFIKCDRYEVRQHLFDGGRTAVLDREVVVPHEAVAVLLYDPARDEVVLVEQARLPAALTGRPAIQTEIVAGRLEPGEVPLETARREVKEETGCRIIGDPIPLFDMLTTPGHSTERIHIFCAQVDAGGVSGFFGHADEHEDIRVLVISADELAARLADGRIHNAFTIIAGLWLAANRTALRAAWAIPKVSSDA